MIRATRARAFAKLNLGLRVLYKRPDGYHELRTVFQTIALADNLEIAFQPSKTTSVVIEGAPEIPDNLAGRAAHAVLQASGKTGHVHITLQKRIPSGAGLGGGSSDAAAVLLALPALAGIRFPIDRLTALAATLGSDVPYFLYGGTALGLGRGEELYPLPDRSSPHVLLIVPPIHSSTAEAYRDLSATLTGTTLTTDALQNKLDSFQGGAWSADKSSIINDFEDVVLARHPALAGIRERLRRAGATSVAMTGSGSALFGLFKEKTRLDRAKKQFPDEQAFAVSFVSRARYRASWRRALAEHIKQTKGNETWPPPSLHAR